MEDTSEHDAWIIEMYPADQYAVVNLEDDDRRPTEKYGDWLGIAVFLGIVVFSFFVVAGIMYVSTAQERAKFSSRRAKRSDSAQARASLGDSLTSKKWSTHTSQTVLTVGDTFADGDDDSANVDVDTVESQMSSSDATPMSDDKEAEAEAMNARRKDGSVCAICSKEYLEEEEIYESNNPRCGHEFHKECMDRWLTIQNACPICSQPFVLQCAG